MEMWGVEARESECQPLLAVSAASRAAASDLIREITRDSQVEEIEKEHGTEYTWLISNKYYEAKVMICVIVDGAQSDAMALPLDAHIIFIQDSKGEGAEQAQARADAVHGGEGTDDAIRLVVCESSPAPAPLALWARLRRYELVERAECAPPDPDRDEAEPFAEQYGVERAVAALHAHVWPNLRRSGAPARGSATADAEAEADELERAEDFAELLGRLGSARDTLRPLSQAERHAQAERIVAAFCRALGHSPEAL